MKKLLLALTAIAVLSTAASAGALFDDYLNYVRPGTGTGPGHAQAATAPGQPIGQSFTIAANTGEVYRIGVRPVYDTWEPDESVTMTLYSSPDKKQKLGEYKIGEATCHVDDYCVGNGSESKHTGDHVLYYQFRKPTAGATTLYFELSADGGDGKVAFQAFNADSYPGGQSYGTEGAKDLSFECDIKPVPDKQANLHAFFTQRLDISRSELAAVKAAVDAGDWERAIAETVKHFRSRMDIWNEWKDVMNVKVDPEADISTADIILQGKMLHADTRRPIEWRKESWWNAVIPDAKQGNHGIDPDPSGWNLDRCLAGAYTATGKDEYARKAIDLRMQYILDNPNPKVVYGREKPFPYYFEVWNDRTAGGRAPGWGTLSYARLYNYPGWTNDEQLVFFSFWEDNANWDYKATSGGNWGVEAARAALDFGVKFPEWKMSKTYGGWGAARMVELSGETVRGDGTSSEAAIKYHSMVARRFKGLLEHVQGSDLKLDQADYDKLLKTTGAMYDHMAYTLQPKGWVVMCGDSWYENFSEDSGFGNGSLKDPKALITKLHDARDPISAYLRSRFERDALELLNSYSGSSAPSDDLQRAVVAQLNRILHLGFLYDAKLFAGIKLRDRTLRGLQLNPHGEDLVYVNKWLIEDAYPSEIRKGYETSELFDTARMLKRPDLEYISSQGEVGTKPTQVSKIYPEGGYFVMRSAFGNPGRDYTDARQMFIHNGGWFGSHGHWDLTSLNLYGFGRTLVIDPGQYSYTPPPGIDSYWASKVHSMMVVEGRDCKREPGPTNWTSDDAIDWFDGIHYGYSNLDGVEYVRRRVAYVKPDYFLVDDSAKTTRDTDYTQVWNLADPYARFYQATGVIDTTFPTGGNVMILNQDPRRCTAEEQEGITASGQYKETTIFRLTQKTDDPHFETLVYPYDASDKPNVSWERILPDDGNLGNLFYSVRVSTDKLLDWAAFGECGKPVSYRGGKSVVDADFAVVRTDPKAGVKGCSWAYGRKLKFNGSLLASADSEVVDLAVRWEGPTLVVDVKEPDSSIAIRMGSAKSVVLNGKPVAKPVVKDGLYYPYADQPVTIVSDDRTSFERLTKTTEWARTADVNAIKNGYTQHETDPGRHENGNYVFDVPKAGTYTVEVFLPRITMAPSDRVDYTIAATGIPAKTGGAVVDVTQDGGTSVVTVNQQAMSGWVKLGDFMISKGTFKVNAKNVTEIDGLYFVADAMRLVERK